MGCCIDFSPKIKQEKKIRCENYREKNNRTNKKNKKAKRALHSFVTIIHFFTTVKT